ncbi:transposase [Rhodobacterales bacterium HKCCA1058]|nr:transposase [Rhodobacterales bacterium HKCCA1058]
MQPSAINSGGVMHNSRATCQAQATINRWIKEYNHIRPHQSLGMRPPIPETTTLKLDQT